MKAKEFKQIRLSLGLSQSQLAKVLGYKSVFSICKKEYGERGISAQDEMLLNILLEKSQK